MQQLSQYNRLTLAPAFLGMVLCPIFFILSIILVAAPGFVSSIGNGITFLALAFLNHRHGGHIAGKIVSAFQTIVNLAFLIWWAAITAEIVAVCSGNSGCTGVLVPINAVIGLSILCCLIQAAIWILSGVLCFFFFRMTSEPATAGVVFVPEGGKN